MIKRRSSSVSSDSVYLEREYFVGKRLADKNNEKSCLRRVNA